MDIPDDAIQYRAQQDLNRIQIDEFVALDTIETCAQIHAEVGARFISEGKMTEALPWLQESVRLTQAAIERRNR